MNRFTLLAVLILFASLDGISQTGPWAKYDNKMKGEALIREADGGNLEEVKSIVAGGADVNWQLQYTGLTPLMAAASNGKTEVVRFLLDKGADPAVKDANGKTALDRAKMFGASDVVKLLGGYDKTLNGPGNKPPVDPKNNIVKPKPADVPVKPINNVPGSWPSFGSLQVGDSVMYFAGSWKRGVIREIGISESKGAKAVATEKEYKIAPDAYANWPEWINWSQVTRPARENFWTSWFTGDWMVGEVMAHTVEDKGADELHTYSHYSATESIRVNADGTYTWKPMNAKAISGKWKAAPDGPGIVLLNGYRGYDWTMRNESSANELHIRKAEKIRLYPSANVMSISGMRTAQ